jgi:hypothetical protein
MFGTKTPGGLRMGTYRQISRRMDDLRAGLATLGSAGAMPSGSSPTTARWAVASYDLRPGRPLRPHVRAELPIWRTSSPTGREGPLRLLPEIYERWSPAIPTLERLS